MGWLTNRLPGLVYGRQAEMLWSPKGIALAQLRLAQYTVGDDGWITDFDLKGLLKPLFEIWDKDGSGEITRPALPSTVSCT